MSMKRTTVEVVYRVTVTHKDARSLVEAVKRLREGVTFAASVGDRAFHFDRPAVPIVRTPR